MAASRRPVPGLVLTEGLIRELPGRRSDRSESGCGYKTGSLDLGRFSEDGRPFCFWFWAIINVTGLTALAYPTLT
jgi:hypothetical protein